MTFGEAVGAIIIKTLGEQKRVPKDNYPVGNNTHQELMVLHF